MSLGLVMHRPAVLKASLGASTLCAVYLYVVAMLQCSAGALLLKNRGLHVASSQPSQNRSIGPAMA